MRTKYKPWAKPYIEEHLEYSLSDEEISSLDDIYLEIGCGKGEFIVDMALNNPDKLFIGVEKNVTCAGISLKKIVEKEIPNIKFLYKDGEQVIRLLKDNSVNRIYLNFSDPWPKKRHFKRRLTNVNFLNEYRRILKSDGLIIFKSDNKDLFDYSIEELKAANFNIISLNYDYDGLDNDDVQTEYEKKFRAQGISIKKVVVGK